VKLPKANPKRIVIYILTVFFSVLFIVVGNHIALGGKRLFDAQVDGEFIKAKVLQIIREEKVDSGDGTATTTIYFKARALQGKNKGKTLDAQQEIDSMFALQLPRVQEDDLILLDIQLLENGQPDVAILYDYVRTGPLLLLAGLFALIVILFGRKKGFDTVLSLVITVLVIFLVLVPSVLTGHNIYLWSSVICVFIVLSNLLLVQGPSLKSVTAAIGCLGGFISAGLIMQLVKIPMHITGLMEEDSIEVLLLNPKNPIDIKATVFSMILVGSVGALMDVAMDIASALWEIREKEPNLPARDLMKSGFSIGKDLIGTMANTLVLAYISGSLSLILLYISYSANVTQIINKEVVAVEVLNSIAGSLAVVVAIIVTSVICSLLYLPRHKKKLAQAENFPVADDEA
jgi:uncharacterized membrane protein